MRLATGLPALEWRLRRGKAGRGGDTTRTSDLSAQTEQEDKGYAWARKRAEEIQGLYIHMLVFAVVNTGLFFLNWWMIRDGGSWWFQWTLIPWGIGLAIHILVTVVPVFSDEWVERRAERIAAKRDLSLIHI